jgi:Glycosyl transferase family 2
MKLVMTFLVRDEADILRANLEFHLAQGVDFFIVSDNLSVDGTTDILEDYLRLGVMHVLRQTTDTYDQGRWVTEMAQMAATTFGADWVINNDADEFWMPRSGNLKQVLSAVPSGIDAIHAERGNFPPRPVQNGIFFPDSMTLREKQSRNLLGMPLPGKLCHRGFGDVVVAQGNHDAQRAGATLSKAIGAIDILHFPLRTFPQFANKISKGGAAYARNQTLPKNVGDTWRHCYQLLQEGKLEELWNEVLLTDEKAANGIAAGDIIRDERLRLFFQTNPPRTKGSRAPQSSDHES